MFWNPLRRDAITKYTKNLLGYCCSPLFWPLKWGPWWIKCNFSLKKVTFGFLTKSENYKGIIVKNGSRLHYQQKIPFFHSAVRLKIIFLCKRSLLVFWLIMSFCPIFGKMTQLHYSDLVIKQKDLSLIQFVNTFSCWREDTSYCSKKYQGFF